MSDIRIRPLADYEELSACVDLQKKTWGTRFDDIVSAALMLVTQKIGGVAAGAFNGDADLIGIVFGLTGIRHDERVHWSHMLAVEPSHQGRGIGRLMKLYQRERALRMGIRTMYWTFDPLEGRNAHFNINRLKVDVDEYVPDMYGSGETSPLHRGIGTDRFVVRWDLDSAETGHDLGQIEWHEDEAVARLQGDGGQGHGPAAIEVTEDLSYVEIPARIQSLKAADPEAARHWRTATRAAFTDYFSRGYRVSAFARAIDTGSLLYLLETP